MALMDRNTVIESASASVGMVLGDCLQALSELEGGLYHMEAKLFGSRPAEISACTPKAASDPPIDFRCRELATRLRAVVKFAESMSDKL